MDERMTRVWLNIDAGELDDEPEELLALAHVVNVACGGHAGDDASMHRVVGRCATLGTGIGAHPSYADREGFGRRAQAVTPERLRALVAEQCERLLAHAEAAGVRVAYVKPHGALYHAADAERALAEALVAGAVEVLGYDVTVIGPAGGALADAAARAGVALAREGFADRGLGPDGKLLPRGSPGALILEPAAAALRAAELASSGRVDTVCVHGDTPGSVAIARAVRGALGS
jgi:5-oxoprolinase (ATP-hydrolysing) subunit A